MRVGGGRSGLREEAASMRWRKTLLVLGVVGSLAVCAASYYAWKFPYGPSHCCDLILKNVLDDYANDHDGKYPVGKEPPESSLSLLHPNYVDANILRGKSVPLAVVQDILDRGELLGPDSCGWHYVEGLTLNDDPRLAVFWDKVGLGHDGQRLGEGDHIVTSLGGQRPLVTGLEWPGFLEEQQKLLASRDDLAREGGPMLVVKIRLPSGQIVDRLRGRYELAKKHVSEDGGAEGTTSGTDLTPGDLRWFRYRS